MSEIKYGPWLGTGYGRYREVFGPFVCETDCIPGAAFYCDYCGDCMACELGVEGYDGHTHRAYEHETDR